jgi:serine/threonine protein kinase
VFADALRRDPEERDMFIDQACAGKPWLRAEVAALLDAHVRAGDFIEAPPLEAAVRAAGSERGQTIEGRGVGPYIIRQEIGRGGMGVVYLADDTRLARRVALKALRPGLSHELGGRERLRREARAAAGLTHPGIATVYALEEIGDELYLACEYVPGLGLRAILESGPLPIVQVVEIAVQLARALSVAHMHGVVHRDLKPENVIRTPSGIVKVLDFGLARVEGVAETRLTQTGNILGTPAYMAPEQALGRNIDHRTDLFSFGLLLYEMTSGINPFAARTATNTIARIIETQPAPLSEVRLDCPPELERVVAICLRKEPAERYTTTEDVVAELEGLQERISANRHRSPSGAVSMEDVRRTPTLTPRWWWEVHQALISAVYTVMILPAWRVQSWLPQPWGILFLLGVLACAASATSLRLHLWFTARFYPGEIVEQYSKILRLTHWFDGGFAVLLGLAALAIGRAHPEFAMLLVTVSASALIAAFVIEPTTAKVAFRGMTGAISAPDKQK